MKHKPKLIIITGRPGSGKTILSKELGKLLYLPVVSRDEIKEGYVNTFNMKHDKLPEDTNGIVTGIFFKNIEFLLSSNVSVIAEAAFQHNVWEPEVTKCQKWANIFVIICEIDAETSASRHLKRGIAEPRREFYHGDKRVAHFKETGIILPAGAYKPPSIDVPTLQVSTLDGYNPELEKIREQIVSSLDASSSPAERIV
ncbi:MAG TPA: AAA family ATPase [Candidatus Andersenbacteria bacterium]|nr:AAA family ATPase [Candidatus Andersenbacteria bacterium]